MRAVRVVMFDDLLSRSNPRVREVPVGTGGITVANAVGSLHLDPCAWVGASNGHAVGLEDVLNAGDELRIAPRPGTGAEVALIAIAVASAIISASMIAGIRHPAAANSSDSEEKRFGFRRFSNDAFAGDVKQVAFGETPREGGKVIARVPVESADGSGEEKVKILITFGHGPIAQIGDRTSDFDDVAGEDLAEIDLNETPIASFPGVRAWGRMGNAGQAVIPGFNDAEQLVEVGAGGFELRNTSGSDRTSSEPSGEAVEFTTTDPIEAAVLRVRFADGLFVVSSKAQVEHVSVRYRFRHKAPGGTYGPWTTITVRQDRQSPFFSSPRIDDIYSAGSPALRTFQVERITSEPTDATIKDRMVFDSALQIVYGAFTYDGFALLAIELVANETIQSVPKISVRIKGQAALRIWDGISDPTAPIFVTGYTANTAWVALEFLTNKTWGMGSVYDDSSVDFPSLIAWATTCDDQIERPGAIGDFRDRHRFNLVAADQRDGVEWLRAICLAGRCTPVSVGATWRFIYDGRQESPVETFGDGSIAVDESSGEASFTYRREYAVDGASRSNQVVLQFENARLEGKVDSLKYPELGELWLATETPRPESVRVDGITDPDEVASHAIYLMSKGRFLTRSVSFVTTKHAVVVQPSDRFDLAMSLPGWGKASGRVLAATSDSIAMDRSVTLAAGLSYSARVTHLDGTLEVVAVTSAAGDYRRGDPLTVEPAFAQVPQECSEYALGEPGIESKPFKCTGVRFLESNEIEIEGVEYIEGVYADTAGFVNSPNYSSLPSPSTPPGAVRDLRVFERIDPTTGKHEAHLAWSQTIDDKSITAGFRIYWRPVGTSTWSLVPGPVVSLRAAVFEIVDLDRGYDFVVVAVSVAGAFLSPFDPSHPIVTLVLGLSALPPPPPSNLAITQTVDNTYQLTWDAEPDAVAYQVVTGGLVTTLPNGGAEDCLVLARPTVNALDGLELPPSEECRFWVRSVGANGRMSIDASEISIASPATPAGDTIKLARTFDLEGEGTRTNLAWNAGQGWLELINPSQSGVYESPEIDSGLVEQTELTFRLDTGSDARDPAIRDVSFGVPSIEADQWGIRYASPKRVGMLMPPYPDASQTFLVEFRVHDGAAWSAWSTIAPFASHASSFDKGQLRVTIARSKTPYRPAIRGLRFVTTS